MSKATNSTQRVIMDGVGGEMSDKEAGEIKFAIGCSFRLNRGVDQAIAQIVRGWGHRRAGLEIAAAEWERLTEEAAQAETVEVEEPAQAETAEATEEPAQTMDQIAFLLCDWMRLQRYAASLCSNATAISGALLARSAQAETVEDHVVVTNDEGRAFSVVVVMQGDRYGLNDCLTHGSPDPLVEFYDAKHSGGVHGPRGQFVSRYYLSTLAGEVQWGHEPGRGLNLEPSVREWSVSWDNVCEAVAYARKREAHA